MNLEKSRLGAAASLRGGGADDPKGGVRLPPQEAQTASLYGVRALIELYEAFFPSMLFAKKKVYSCFKFPCTPTFKLFLTVTFHAPSPALSLGHSRPPSHIPSPSPSSSTSDTSSAQPSPSTSDTSSA